MVTTLIAAYADYDLNCTVINVGNNRVNFRTAENCKKLIPT